MSFIVCNFYRALACFEFEIVRFKFELNLIRFKHSSWNQIWILSLELQFDFLVMIRQAEV